jgi:hypothetical protein
MASYSVPSMIAPLVADVILHTPIPLYTHSLVSTVRDTFNANSPYHTDGVNSALALGVVANLYNGMLVTASRISVTVTNTSATIPLKFVIYPSITSAGVTSYPLAIGQRFAVCGEVCPAGSGPNTRTVSATVDLKRFLGLQNLSTSDSLFTSTPSSAPGSLLYWQIFYSSSDGFSNISVDEQVNIYFKTRLYFPVNVAF